MLDSIALVSTAAAAVRLGVQSQTLRKWRVAGHGPPYVRFGGPCGRVSYRLADLDAWLASRTFPSTSAESAAREAPASRR